jgi:hypothetical protein
MCVEEHWLVETSTSRGLPIDCNRFVASRRCKSLCPVRRYSSGIFRQPLDAPKTLVTLAMSGHTCSSFHVPYFDLAIEASTQQVLAGMTPIETRNPSGMTTEVSHLFTRGRVIERNDAGIASSCEQRRARGKLDRANRLDQSWQGV